MILAGQPDHKFGNGKKLSFILVFSCQQVGRSRRFIHVLFIFIGIVSTYRQVLEY